MPVVYGNYPRYAEMLTEEIDRLIELIGNETSGQDSPDGIYYDRIRLHLIGFRKEIHDRLDKYKANLIAADTICEGVYV